MKILGCFIAWKKYGIFVGFCNLDYHGKNLFSDVWKFNLILLVLAGISVWGYFKMLHGEIYSLAAENSRQFYYPEFLLENLFLNVHYMEKSILWESPAKNSMYFYYLEFISEKLFSIFLLHGKIDSWHLKTPCNELFYEVIFQVASPH